MAKKRKRKRKSRYAPYEGGAWTYGPSVLHRHRNAEPGERAAKLRRMIQHAEQRGGVMYDRMIAVYRAELAALHSMSVKVIQHQAA